MSETERDAIETLSEAFWSNLALAFDALAEVIPDRAGENLSHLADIESSVERLRTALSTAQAERDEALVRLGAVLRTYAQFQEAPSFAAAQRFLQRQSATPKDVKE